MDDPAFYIVAVHKRTSAIVRTGFLDTLEILKTRDAHWFSIHVSETRFHHSFITNGAGDGISNFGRFRLRNRNGGYRKDSLLGCRQYPLGKILSILADIIRHILTKEHHANTLSKGVIMVLLVFRIQASYRTHVTGLRIVLFEPLYFF